MVTLPRRSDAIPSRGVHAATHDAVLDKLAHQGVCILPGPWVGKSFLAQMALPAAAQSGRPVAADQRPGRHQARLLVSRRETADAWEHFCVAAAAGAEKRAQMEERMGHTSART